MGRQTLVDDVQMDNVELDSKNLEVKVCSGRTTMSDPLVSVVMVDRCGGCGVVGVVGVVERVVH